MPHSHLDPPHAQTGPPTAAASFTVMCAPRPHPCHANANLRPADIVLAARQTCWSLAEVQKEKATLEVQCQLLIQK